MGLSLPRARVALAAALTTAAAVAFAVPQAAAAHEIALAQGTVAISEAAAGQQAPACGELVVEARDALDNHLIGRTRPAVDAGGECRYAISVPAQSAVWLRIRPALVAGTHVTPDVLSGGVGVAAPHAARAPSSRSVALRFTVIAPTTFFFAPGEQKTVPLAY